MDNTFGLHSNARFAHEHNTVAWDLYEIHAAVPIEFVPMKLPRTLLPEVAGPLISTPCEPLPEITLPAPGSAPPTTFDVASELIVTPSVVFGSGFAPTASVPM